VILVFEALVVLTGLVFLGFGLAEHRRASFFASARPVATPGDLVALTGTVVCDAPAVLPGWGTRTVYYLVVLGELAGDDHQGADGAVLTRPRRRVTGSWRQRRPFRLACDDGTPVAVAPGDATEYAATEIPSDVKGQELLAGALLGREAPGRRVRVDAVKVGAPATVVGRLERDGHTISSPLLIASQDLAAAVAARRGAARVVLWAACGLLLFGGLTLALSLSQF